MEIIVRASILYFAILLLVRAMGKRELSEISAFELLLMVTMGDLIQQGVTQEDYSVTGAMLAIGTLGAWILVFSYASFKLRSARDVLEGIPLTVVEQGKPEVAVLHNERIPMADLLDAAREQGIGDLAEVRFAVLEPDGKFSFVKDDGEQASGGQEHSSTE